MGDFAHQMRWLADEAYTKAEKIRVVLDNLNTHRPASLYETFDPAEARRILKRLEFHYTPKHGSWLNMAEIELSVFSRQCLNRRIPDGATLTRELAALVRRRNEAHATIAWRFVGCTDHFASSLSYPAKSSGLTTSALERLGPVPQNGTTTNKVPIAEVVEEAFNWVRRVRTEGQDWQLLPEPSVPELYPNMGGADDDMMLASSYDELEPGDEEDGSGDQWEGVKRWLADELRELTQLWQVGVNQRKDAHSGGIYRWDDPGLKPAKVGITGPKQGPVLQQLLAVNRGDGPPVLPLHIGKTLEEWHAVPDVEFYVDFEYCSDLNDDFSKLPEKGGQPFIFMIGCGHVENGEWQFNSLVANDLSETEEVRIIQEWMDHMSAVRDRLDPTNGKPRILHWSPAEPTTLQNAHNSAWSRHSQPADWPVLGWYDFLQKVMREEPVVVRGALGFGLKTVANAMHLQGLIETNWADSQVDGLGAMVGVWRCDEEARRRGVPLTSVPLMDEIARYNEIDCKVMMEIVRYLRANH